MPPSAGPPSLTLFKVTGYSLLIILIYYFAKSIGCMELSFMVLCKIDKYYNQVKF